jgi:hypothetical protein
LATLQTCGLLIRVAKPSYTTGTLGEIKVQIFQKKLDMIINILYNKNMKRVIFSLFIAFSCFRIYAQDIVDNLDMFLSTKYINSNENSYIYLEIYIYNRNPDTIYILKDYSLSNIVENDDGIILFLSSWISRIDLLKHSSALYHNPRMVEIRSRQTVYIPILIQIPDEMNIIGTNKVIKKIEGLKYSLVEYITADISWARNVDEFAQNILDRVNDLDFNYNEYTHKYGNIIVSQIKPPEWMLGTWKTDGKTLPDGNIINSTLRYLKVVENDFFEERLVSSNSYLSESIHGWLITRVENTISQSYGENNYKIDIVFENGRIDYYYFHIDNGYLFMHHKNHNGLFIFRFERE